MSLSTPNNNIIITFIIFIICLIFYQLNPFDYIYSKPDQDFILIYQAILIDNLRNPEYFDHPGFYSYWFLYIIYKIFYILGIINKIDLNIDTNIETFILNFENLVILSRFYILITMCLISLFTYKIFFIFTKSFFFSTLLAIFLFTSFGYIYQLQILRTESISILFFCIAFYFFLKFVYEKKNIKFILIIGIFLSLSLITKIQIILFVSIFFLILLFEHKKIYLNEKISLVKKDIFFLIFLMPLVILGTLSVIIQNNFLNMGNHPLPGSSQINIGIYYQLLILLFMGSFFIYINNYDYKKFIKYSIFLIFGFSIPFYITVFYDQRFLSYRIIFNFLEHISIYSTLSELTLFNSLILNFNKSFLQITNINNAYYDHSLILVILSIINYSFIRKKISFGNNTLFLTLIFLYFLIIFYLSFRYFGNKYYLFNILYSLILYSFTINKLKNYDLSIIYNFNKILLLVTIFTSLIIFLFYGIYNQNFIIQQNENELVCELGKYWYSEINMYFINICKQIN